MIGFKYGDLEFSGFPLNKYEEYPWSNKKEKDTFYKELIEDATDTSKEKLKLFMHKETMESIHVNFSRYMVFLGMAILSVLFLFAATTLLPLIVTGGFVAGFGIAALVSINRAKKEYFGMKTLDLIVDMIFDMENEVQDK